MERLSASQRKKILQRDDFTSQMRHYSEEKGFHTGCADCPIPDQRKLQVHHVNPFGNGGSNNPDNLLTIFQCEHIGKRCDNTLVDPREKFVVHPDMVQGLQNYRKGDKKAINKVMEQRKPLKEKGDIYWQTDHDAEMKQTAEQRTKDKVARGWKFW